MTAPLVAPFPYFGGKRRVAAEVWRRFGNVRSYVEPFFGSGAVLLARPRPFSGVETVNDLDGLLCNFWRAVKADPAAVAETADWPVSECDLHARHLWLVERREDITGRLMADPAWFDAQAAGWWVWGACAWIGSGWCSGNGPWVRGEGGLVLSNAGQGINRKLPHLGNAGRGINRQLPHLGNAGRGINRQLPHLGDAGRGILAAFEEVAARLRGVRIAAGEWDRIVGDSVTWRHGVCGVFLDPPYVEGAADYAVGGTGSGIAHDVRAWAIEAGARPDMRIALCGYDEHEELAGAGWSAHRWKAAGGYGSQGDGAGRANSAREVVWFSPHCVGAAQPGLFDAQPIQPGRPAKDGAA